MRYLNKIVFINSASVSFSEIDLNGNVHFIGTQGVGKSTLLRAILFFYNADKMKLGIPREKKRFDEYYFQFENSYIVYEVMRDGNPFCVLAFKKNGRVAFRFFDAAFSRDLFIDKDNRAFESWEKIRTAFHKNNIYHSKTISSYEEFRQIIYGDNKGMKPEFKKYALLESKQFQNIPRTIQNVLLNSKLEAKFIKETIIKSLNENEIKIDLRNYSHSHLRDFETELNDIKIWSKKSGNGQIFIRRQAKSVIKNYRAYNYLIQERQEIATQLAARIRYVEQEKPKITTTFATENDLLLQREKEVAKLAQLHKKREQTNISAIYQIKAKLKEAADKKYAYKNQHIEAIKSRVANKDLLVQEDNQLKEEKHLLTADFAEISHKYTALVDQANNQLIQFSNQKNAAINQSNSDFSQEKTKLTEGFSALLVQIEEEYAAQIDQAKNKVESYRDDYNKLDKDKAKLFHKEFFKEELEEFRQKARKLETTINTANNQIIQHNSEIETLRLKWEQGERETKQQAEHKIEAQQKTRDKLNKKSLKIKTRIEQSKSSLYGWLNENVKGWEKSIGKVIDEEVLFDNTLSPKLIAQNISSFYGIGVNLNSLESRTKTVAQYQAEITNIQSQVADIGKGIQALQNQQKNQLDKLKKRFQAKINALKDEIDKAQHLQERAKTKLAENKTRWANKRLAAKEEKENQLASLDQKLDKTANDKLVAERNLLGIREELKRKKQRKNRERDKAIQAALQANLAQIATIKAEIAQQEKNTKNRIKEIQAAQNTELANKGADSQRLAAIEKRLQAITASLAYIKANERLVFEYDKDKRELFDKIPYFKAEKDALEKKQLSMEEDHRLEKLKMGNKCEQQRKKVHQIGEQVQKFKADLIKFEEFKKSETYAKVKAFLDPETEKPESSDTAINIIAQLNDIHYRTIDLINEIRKSVAAFTGNFKEHNVFSFKTVMTANEEYLEFARGLKEFMDEDKISDYEKRVNEKFAHIIQLIGKETQALISKEAEIEKVIRKINNDFSAKNFVGAIKKMEIRTQPSSNKIMRLLLAIKEFNDEHAQSLGEVNLFNNEEEHSRANKNEKAVDMLKRLVKDLNEYKPDAITLSESFDLQFRIVENDNDSGWVEKLANVGSEGTDVLVKAMINILLLNVFKENASKKFKDFKLHCMMDEVGRLHPNNVKGILRFANDRNILLINGSPTSLNAMDYRYTYNLSKKQSKQNKKRYITRIQRLIKTAARPKSTSNATKNIA